MTSDQGRVMLPKLVRTRARRIEAIERPKKRQATMIRWTKIDHRNMALQKAVSIVLTFSSILFPFFGH